MKIAIAGKGGVGKTSLAAWLGQSLALLGKNVYMVDADTATSLGQACGLDEKNMPLPLAAQKDLLHERTTAGGGSLLSLTPKVDDLPELLSVPLPKVGTVASAHNQGNKRLLLMGGLHHADGGCACEANALLKALLAHLVLERNDWVVVDTDAGVEHLGRGTVASVDKLIIVAEPSLHSLNIAAQIGRMAKDLGLHHHTLAINRAMPKDKEILSRIITDGLPKNCITIPPFPELLTRRAVSASVLGLSEDADTHIHKCMQEILGME